MPNRSLERAVAPLLPLLEAELNVKRIDFASSADELVTLEAKPNFRALGKKFGKATPLAAQAVAALSSETLRALEHGQPVAVTVNGETHELDADDVQIVRRAAGDLSVAGSGAYLVAIDKTVTPALRQEGLVRELISRVQRMRKEAGLAVSDRIRLRVHGPVEVEEAARQHSRWIAEEVLATELAVGGDVGTDHTAVQTVDLDGLAVSVAITRDS